MAAAGEGARGRRSSVAGVVARVRVVLTARELRG